VGYISRKNESELIIIIEDGFDRLKKLD